MNESAKRILEKLVSNETPIAEGGVLKAAVDEIKKLRIENEQLKNPQIWTNDGEL